MICRKCGETIEDNALFCTNCGEKTVKADSPEQNNAGYQENVSKGEAPAQDNYGYQNNFNAGANSAPSQDAGFYSAPGAPYGQNTPYSNGAPWYPPINDKAASVKDYLKWMLLYPLWALIPGVGFIIYLVVCFKYAFDETFKARSNFFKATLITMAISVCFAVVMCIIMFGVVGGLVSSGMDTFSEMYPELYEEFAEGYYNAMRIFFGS